jgi:hypothetical protein
VAAPLRTLAFAAFVAAAPASFARADEPPPCRFICDLAWKIEPTFTIENLANRHRVIDPDGTEVAVSRERVFETILALDLETRVPRLGFSAEVATSPFNDDNSVEIEFEANLYWLTEQMTRGWVSSHVDVVDQFSPAERPADSRPYTHKLDFELDTAVHIFKWLPETSWLHALELETSLDYLASGTPRAGDIFSDGTRYLDDASGWSFSFVIVIPVAPF